MASHFAAEFNDRGCQGCTFCRISAGTQFVEQYQCSVITLSYHIHNSTHMAGEGGKALGNGLLITDICQNGVECGQFAAVAGRDVQTTFCHQCQQTDGFQSNGFTASIGSGDDHGIKVTAKPNRDGDNCFCVDQRMSCLAQVYPALVIHDGCPSTHPVSKLCLGKDHIQLNQHVVIQIDRFSVTCSLAGQFCQNPFNFFLFLQFQLPQSIVGIDCGHGFHKIGTTGSRNIVHKTRHIILAFAFHRNHITALADGNYRLPEEFGIGGRRNNFLKTVTDLSCLDTHMTADVRQFRRCVVSDFFFRQNGAEDFIFQVFIGGQRPE